MLLLLMMIIIIIIMLTVLIERTDKCHCIQYTHNNVGDIHNINRLQFVIL